MNRFVLRMDAMSVHASGEAMEASQSFASLRHLPSHAKVLSTTHRLAMTTKLVTPGGRLTTSTNGPLNFFTASLTPSLGGRK